MSFELPEGLAAPARRALAAAGYTRLEQFTSVTEAELLELHGIGPKAVATIRDALDWRGLTFACRPVRLRGAARAPLASGGGNPHLL